MSTLCDGWTYQQNLLSYSSKLSDVQMHDAALRLVHHSVLEAVGISPELSEHVEQYVRVGEMNKGNYIEWTLPGSKGWMTIAFDGIRLLIEAFVKGRDSDPVKILRAAIRDRQKDGRGSTADTFSPLTSFGNADKPFNRLDRADLQVAELSIYSWEPATMLEGTACPGTVAHFIADPDSYIWAENFNQVQFYKLWEQALRLNRAPWQTGLPMPAVPSFFVKQTSLLAKELGYDAIDEVPSWFNVVDFFKREGFEFTFGEHKLVFEHLQLALAECAPKLSIYQQAWLVALQNIPRGSIPNRLRLLVRWPCTHTNELWPRMHLNTGEYGIGRSSCAPNMEGIFELLK